MEWEILGDSLPFIIYVTGRFSQHSSTWLTPIRLHVGSDLANIRIGIRINPKIYIRIPDHFWLRLDALGEVCALRAQSSYLFFFKFNNLLYIALWTVFDKVHLLIYVLCTILVQRRHSRPCLFIVRCQKLASSVQHACKFLTLASSTGKTCVVCICVLCLNYFLEVKVRAVQCRDSKASK